MNRLDQLNNEYDICIIGAGINGSSVAACLAAMGYKVALLEKKDFASFTSQESSNLIWGGIKYLENYEFKLVNDLCLSRNKLMKFFPSKVQEIRFLATRYAGDAHWLFTYVLGTWLYQVLGRFYTKRPKWYSKEKLKSLEGAINTDRSNGGIEYSDSFIIDNDARFIYHFVESAIEHGAHASNYTSVEKFDKDQNRWLITIKDQINQDTKQIHSKWIINTAGPFADTINRQNQLNTEHKHLFSKGIHLIVPQITKKKHVITFLSEDKRPVYIIPMQNRSCVGTTDTRVNELPPVVTEEDREFVLRNVNAKLDLDQPLQKKDIIAERCGVRPLAVKNDTKNQGDGDWLSISRKHEVEANLKNHFITIFGGKLTDCLNTAEEVKELIATDSPTPENNKRWFGEKTEQKSLTTKNLNEVFSAEQTDRLWRRYGTKAIKIKELHLDLNLNSESIFGDQLYFPAEIIYIIQNEKVETLEDLFRRRTEISLINKIEDIKNNNTLKNICTEFLFNKDNSKWDDYFRKLS